MTAPYQPQRPLRPRNNAIPGNETQSTPQPQIAPNTFRGMQQRGLARPAPPPNSYYQTPQPATAAPAPVAPRPNVAQPAAPVAAPAAPSYATYAPPTDPNRAALTNAVGQLLAQPSAYQSSDLQRDYSTLNDQLGLDAQSGKKAIDQTMAARGLHASTLTGDAYGNLEKQQGVTRANFANQYLDHEASDLATARANAISAALGVQGENADEGLAAFGANQASQNQAHNQSMDVANLGLQTELGRGNLGVSQQNADTSSAAQTSTAANQAGTLQLGRDTLTANSGNAAADRAQQLAMQGNELGFSREQLAANTNQSDLDRALQQMLGVGNLDLNNRQLDSSNTNAAADRTLQTTLQGNQLASTNTNAAADRANALTLQGNQLASTNANAAADREQAGKIAADSLGLNYAQLSEQQKESLADLGLRQSALDSSNTNATADRTQQMAIANLADTRSGQQIDANKQVANTNATLQAFTLAAQLGLDPNSALVQNFINALTGKTPPPSSDQPPKGNTPPTGTTPPHDPNTPITDLPPDPNDPTHESDMIGTGAQVDRTQLMRLLQQYMGAM